MAGKKPFKIESPRGTIVHVHHKNGDVTAKLTWKPGYGPKKAEDFQTAQDYVDSEVLRLMAPLTPRRTGMMIKSATLGTVIGSGVVEYLAPYARRQYYEHKTKKKWFETMKAAHKEKIRKGAARFVAGKP